MATTLQSIDPRTGQAGASFEAVDVSAVGPACEAAAAAGVPLYLTGTRHFAH